MDPLQEEQENVSVFSSLLLRVRRDSRLSKLIIFSSGAVILFVVFIFLLSAPHSFPQNKTITIEKGASLKSVSTLLHSENIIRSQTLFELCARIIGGSKPVVAGSYLFESQTSSCAVAFRIAHGDSRVPAIRVTIPEGMSNRDMADILAKYLPLFSRDEFIKTLAAQEGYLFPDTYFFSEATTAETAGNAMLVNFSKKTAPLKDEVIASGHSLREIIIMASILEKEATTNEDRAIVSGILWKRISIGMPLQVDATFMYLFDKKSNELTLDDLQTKSPYNTYQNKGLPPGPIGNPGLDAIIAALHPTASPYLYYLSDNNGVMHYSKTFEEHKANKAKYLR